MLELIKKEEYGEKNWDKIEILELNKLIKKKAREEIKENGNEK